MKRGEIYWAHLNPRSGSEQFGNRPVILISDDVFNDNVRWSSMIVVPVSTSEKQSQRGPTAIFLPKGTAGLKRSSVALCHQITTLDRSKLKKRMGMLPQSLISQVEEGLKVALSLLE